MHRYERDVKAGRDLDALVAEKVMGFTVAHCLPVFSTQDEWYERVPITKDGGLERALSYYSTDIAAAWEVVGKLHGKISLQGPGTTDMGEGYATYGTWTAQFQPKGEQTEVTEKADTAPLAICLAALKAVGVEVPE